MAFIHGIEKGPDAVPTQRALRQLTQQVEALRPTVQSITGATTADQVESIIAALVALGLATDDR